MLVVGFGPGAVDQAAALRRLAETSGATGRFHLVAPVPTNLAPAAAAAALAQASADARTVADTLATDGVPPEHITLALAGDAGHPPREVRVHLR